MKLLVVLCLVAVAAAAPYNTAKILRYDNNNIGVGNYRYAFQQSDGSKQEQFGELRNEGKIGQALVVRGSYSWNAPDGFNYVVKYVADEYGYRSTIEKVQAYKISN